MTDWQDASLMSLVRFRNGKSSKGVSEGTVPIYGSNGVIGTADRHMYQNAIILGRVGAYCGSVEYCRDRFWATDNTIVVEPVGGILDVPFAYYMLLQAGLNRYAGGSAQPLLTQTNLKRVVFQVPPLQTQRRIASILRAYDDLIEVNQRRVAVLEEMARGLFEEWFVRFRFPGHENAPILDTPDGPLPEGWSIVPLGELLEHSIGGLWGEREASGDANEPVAVVRGTDFPRLLAGQFDSVPTRFVSGKELSKRAIVTGDLILEASGGSKDQPVGRALFVSDGLIAGLGAAAAPASFCRLLRPQPQSGLAEYIHGLLQAMYDDRRIEKFQKQSTGLRNLSMKQLAAEPIAKPGDAVLRSFGSKVRPMIDAMAVYRNETRYLSASRDLLLPRLISGQLSVQSADRELAVAA